MTLQPLPEFDSLILIPTSEGTFRLQLQGSWWQEEVRHREQELHKVLDLIDQEDIVLDMSALEMINSLGIDCLIRLHARLKKENRTLTLINIQDQVYQIFDLVKLPCLIRCF